MEYRINLTDDTVEKLGTALGEPIQELEQEILDKEEIIAEKDEIIAEKQAIIDAFPTIESKNITANGTYSEQGKAYSPVVVNVPQTTVEALSVTQNGTYSEQGKAYSPVTVNVPEGITASDAPYLICFDNNFVIHNKTENPISVYTIEASASRNDPLTATHGYVKKISVSAGQRYTMGQQGNMLAVSKVRDNGSEIANTSGTSFAFQLIIEGGIASITTSPVNYIASVSNSGTTNTLNITIPKAYAGSLIPSTGKARAYISDSLVVEVN